eukprot:6194231-Pleurochrysis_carterae.AAC.1
MAAASELFAGTPPCIADAIAASEFASAGTPPCIADSHAATHISRAGYLTQNRGAPPKNSLARRRADSDHVGAVCAND